eukprot:EG_transcript_20044
MAALLRRATRLYSTGAVSPALLQQLAPTGTLRAAFNMRNALLVSGKRPDGEPDGVGPALARELAKRLGVPAAIVPFRSPPEVVAAIDANVWDVCFLGAEPERADKISFTPAYVEIEATYLVPGDSPYQRVEELDREGVRIAVPKGSAYDLYLGRTLQHAALAHADGLDAAFALFVQDRLPALAGLRPRLLEDAGRLPGSRLVAGGFTSIQQAIATHRPKAEAFVFLCDFVRDVKHTALLRRLLEQYHVADKLTVPTE